VSLSPYTLKVGADDSDWLAAEQARKRRIKIYVIIGIVIVSSSSLFGVSADQQIAMVIAGVVLGVVMTSNSHSDARPKALNRPVDE
jgi:uncharacterized RDD family membrane protein YckC